MGLLVEDGHVYGPVCLRASPSETGKPSGNSAHVDRDTWRSTLFLTCYPAVASISGENLRVTLGKASTPLARSAGGVWDGLLAVLEAADCAALGRD